MNIQFMQKPNIVQYNDFISHFLMSIKCFTCLLQNFKAFEIPGVFIRSIY